MKPPLPPKPQNISDIAGTQFGSSDFGDIDQDGDLDLIVCGSGKLANVTTLYRNDGNGTFSPLKNKQLPSVVFSAVVIKDVNNDNWPDIFITGNYNGTSISRLLINLGNYAFQTYDPITFIGVSDGTINIEDFDNDGDQDILLSGNEYPNYPITILYENTGTSFVSVQSSFAFVNKSASAVYDFDGDGLKDVILSGLKVPNTNLCEYYKNQGGLNFSLQPNIQFSPFRNGSIAIADVDSNGLVDVFTSGYHQSNVTAALYLQDSIGHFRKDLANTFTPFQLGDATFYDYDLDSDLDLIFLGQSASLGTNVSGVYANNGLGQFSLAPISFRALHNSHLLMADLNADNLPDLFTSGNAYTQLGAFPSSSLHFQNSAGQFAEVNANMVSHYFAPQHSEAYDFNGDGFIDLAINGLDSLIWSKGRTKFFLNDTSGNLLPHLNHGLIDFKNGDMDFADVDNDNDFDAIIIGDTSLSMYGFSKYTASIYKNNGQGVYSFGQKIDPYGFFDGRTKFGDIDGDGDADLVISGKQSSFNITAKASVFINNGSGQFTIKPNTNLVGLEYPTVDLIDLDNDGDLDLFMTGKIGNVGNSKLYLNDSTGNFTLVNNTPFTAVFEATTSFADVDGDNDLDLFLSGSTVGSSPPLHVSELYINLGNATFALDTISNIRPFYFADSEFADLDQDGDQDLIVSGASNHYAGFTDIYVNNGLGVLTLQTGTSFESIYHSSVETLDFDHDNDVDLFLGGHRSSDAFSSSKLYENIPCPSAVMFDTTIACNQFVWGVNNCSYTTSGVYQDTVKYIETCDTIRVLILTVIPLSSDVSNGGNYLFAVDSTASQYHWLDCSTQPTPIAGANNQTFYPSQSGYYALAVEKNGCQDTSMCTFWSGIGLEDNTALSIKVYPNPFTETIQLTFDSNNEPELIYAMDLTGKMVGTTLFVSNGTAQIKLSGKPGFYILVVVAKNGTESQHKVFKQ
jgi:hypothetical protein